MNHSKAILTGHTTKGSLNKWFWINDSLKNFIMLFMVAPLLGLKSGVHAGRNRTKISASESIFSAGDI